jgi:catechol 2,3-dioxygenase-like lactoylglutathione lyase family enzyme
MVTPIRKIQSQGVHHITLVGADRQTSIDFWEGVLGMPFVFEQPNLDNAAESHLSDRGKFVLVPGAHLWLLVDALMSDGPDS